MPISSTQIQNILATQVGMFASSAQYAQAVSAQYGYQPSGASVDDPRNSQPLQAGMFASGAIRSADLAPAGLGAAAMFGMAPRVFDPFTGTAGAMASAYGSSGVAGAVGAGAAMGGAYLALGSIYKWSADQLVIGAQQRGMMNAQMGQLAPGAGAAQLGQMSSMVAGAARSGMGSLQDITSMMQAGAQDGSLNTQSIAQFQQSFQKLLGNVRQVASALSTTLTEAQQAMQSVRSLGVGSDQAAPFLGSMRMIGQGAGMSPQQMYGIASQGSAFGRQLGLNPQSSAMSMMVNQGVLGMVEKGGLIEGVGPNSYGRYAQGAMRFLGSAPGQRVLAAMMTEGGELDQDVAGQIASGALSRQEIRRMASRNLSRRGSLDMLGARSGELAGEFINQYGPQAINPALQAMTSGGAYGQRPETMRAMLTGLTRDELGQMGDLNRMMPSLRNRLMEEGRAGFQEGTRRAGLAESLDAQIGQLVAPLRDRLRQYGADLTQSVQQTIEGVTRDFMGSPPQQADPSVYARYMRQYFRGGGVNNIVSRRAQPHMGGMSADYMGASIPQAQSFLGNAPSGMRIGSMDAGVGFGDLPFNGLGTESYNPAQTAGAAFAQFGAGPLGKAMFEFGGGMRSVGQATGVFGLGGVGTAAGTARLGGLAMQAGGLGLRALGGVGLAISAYDVGTNVMPALSRGLGYSPVTEGAVLGDRADMLKYMSQNNMLEGARLQTFDLGPTGGIPEGMTPVGGMIRGRGISEANRQMAAGDEFREQFNRFARGAPGVVGAFNQQGPEARQNLERALLSSSNIDMQVKEFARLNGMTEDEARKILVAGKMTKDMRAKITGFDEVSARKKLLSQDTQAEALGKYRSNLLNAPHAVAMQAMDPDIAGKAGQPTLDRFIQGLEERGTPLDSDKAEDELLRYFDRTLPNVDTSVRHAVAIAIRKGKIGPEGPGSLYTDLAARADAKDMFLFAEQDRERLLAQDPSARATGRLAAGGGGIPGSITDDYFKNYLEGGMLTALQDVAKRLAIDPTITGTGLMKSSSMLFRDSSEATQRLGVVEQNLGQFMRLRKRKASDQQIVEQMLGADFSGISRRSLRDNFGNIKNRKTFDTGVEAAITQEFMELQRAGLGEGEKPDLTAATNMTNRLFDALQTKNDPKKLALLMGEIATMRAAAGGASRPGDVAKNMDELTSRLGKFSESLDNAKRKLDNFSDNQSR